ncbi:MAG: Thioredoxin reductase [Patescibacteria group bacterium]|nr:Thioredoxin reductase [Patescibacteria group bacterium]
MADNKYDVIIVGGGPAGLTAAIYSARRAMKTLIVSMDIGGQMAMTNSIENYPGYEEIDGPLLGQKMLAQAEKSGSTLVMAEVAKIEKQADGFLLETVDGQQFLSRAVIMAFGLTPRNLNVPGEKEFTGRGVAYCATCDGPLYKGKTVAVIGGGNSAMDAAEYLSKIVEKVYILVRQDKFRGEEVLMERVKSEPKIEILFESAVQEIKGDKKIETLVYDQKGESKEIKIDGVFVEIGHVAKTDWVKDLLNLTDMREININMDCETNTPGVFAAGDITQTAYKQVVISAGEGAKAALQAYKYLQGGKVSGPDWNK